MNIIVSQYYTSNIVYGKYSEEINAMYCKQHGYTYFLETNDSLIKNKSEDRTFNWYKIFLVLNTLEKYPECDYVLYLDMDAIFFNQTKKIEEFITNDFDILMTEDFGTSFSNTGVILFKNNNVTKTFLKDWWDAGSILPQYKNKYWFDQSCIEIPYNKMENKNKLKLIPTGDLNANEFVTNPFIYHSYLHERIPTRNLDKVYYNIFKLGKPTHNKLY
jgi:hypothetical protein